MKWIKRIFIVLAISTIVFLAFYNPMAINLEGDWHAKSIVIDGKPIFPGQAGKLLDFGPQVQINNWGNSISFPIADGDMQMRYQIESGSNGNYLVTLTSSEKSLNGIFTLKVDTLHVGPRAYRVEIQLKRDRTFLIFQRDVYIGPWKPEFPRRGQV